MRAYLWIAGAVLIAILSFWAGLVAHFPGAALSRYVESQVNRLPGVSVRVAPAELGWTAITLPQVRVDGTFQAQPAFLLALTDTEIPLSWALWGGLPLHTRLGPAGEVTLYWPWQEGVAVFTARGLRLESIPALALLPAKRIQGSVEVDGELAVRPEAIPEGQVTGRFQGVEIAALSFLGQTVERTRLDDVRLQLQIGPRIRIDTLEFQGDIQGSATGTVTPNFSRPDTSALDLQINIGIRSEWIQQWGPFAPVAESFLVDGRLSGTLRGTPARPVFRNGKDRP